MRGASRTERARQYLVNGVLTEEEICIACNISVQRLYQIKWREKHPGYNTRKMAEYRGRDRKHERSHHTD